MFPEMILPRILNPISFLKELRDDKYNCPFTFDSKAINEPDIAESSDFPPVLGAKSACRGV
jgi:hypothetical protein